MPPKRKRTNTDPQPTASTSRSTRRTTGGGAADTSSTRDSSTSKSKSKTSAKSTAGETSKRKSQILIAQKKLEDPAEPNSESEEQPEPPRKRGKKKPATSPKKKASAVDKWSPYSRTSMETLFATFADKDDPSVIGGDGLERLCTEAKIPMEGAQPLLLAWLLEASDLGRLKKEEWLRGLNALQIDTLEKLSFALSQYENLLILDVPCPNPHGTTKKHAPEPYNRDVNYWMYGADVPKAFVKFYVFVFFLAKAPQERSVDIEIAKAFWTALLSAKYPIVNELVEFINDRGNVRGVNKDLWAMTLDFCKTFNDSLDGFELDGAWPTLLDEFYTWKMAKQPPDTGDRDRKEE